MFCSLCVSVVILLYFENVTMSVIIARALSVGRCHSYIKSGISIACAVGQGQIPLSPPDSALLLLLLYALFLCFSSIPEIEERKIDAVLWFVRGWRCTCLCFSVSRFWNCCGHSVIMVLFLIIVMILYVLDRCVVDSTRMCRLGKKSLYKYLFLLVDLLFFFFFSAPAFVS